MKRYSLPILFLWSSVFFSACPDPPPAPGIPGTRSPIPEQKAAPKTPAALKDDSNSVQSPTSLVRGPLVRRYATPGSIRFVVKLDIAITGMRWSTLAGLVVSAGREVHNITSTGEHRFRFVAGISHQLFAKGESEVVWSPEFGHLTELLRWGRTGWRREWTGELSSDSRGEIYLVDASTVSAIDTKGQDKWRLSFEGVRKIDGPFPCEKNALFQGTSGLSRVALKVSPRGALIAKTDLDRGAVLIGAGPNCEPLVWLGREVALVDPGGKVLWKHPLPTLPFVERLINGFAFVSARGEKPAAYKTVTDRGSVLRALELPVSGRLTRGRLIPGRGNFTQSIGLCTDVTSPCAKPGSTRGPFNALILTGPRTEPRSLIRHVQGHLGFSEWPEGGLLTASSANDQSTDVTLRNRDHSIEWNVILPGRLSAGPYVGPSSEVYVATCRGFECAPPFQLIAITGKPPEEDPESTNPTIP